MWVSIFSMSVFLKLFSGELLRISGRGFFSVSQATVTKVLEGKSA